MQPTPRTRKREAQHLTAPSRRLELPPRRRPPANLALWHRHRHAHAFRAGARVWISGRETAGAAAEVREGVVAADGVVAAGAAGEGRGAGEGGGCGGGAGGEEGGVEGGRGGVFQRAAWGLETVGCGAADVGDGPGGEAGFEGGAG